MSQSWRFPRYYTGTREMSQSWRFPRYQRGTGGERPTGSSGPSCWIFPGKLWWKEERRGNPLISDRGGR
ncbi:hypothetical protein GDO81_018445 [Engystomops pustulosus]|uniref:Uncharacterized protein n=1 Tax=Engystomops pustulosus TaxID=76066 RepID=A0AAV6ZNY3_ENGPU|nr:hypothetical protein GDO81_018445 [Engystomops pustulosus]